MIEIQNIEEALGWARNQQVSSVILQKVVEYYLESRDRQLAESLFLNKNLTTELLDAMIDKTSLDLQLLAIIHPNLSLQKQQQIVTYIEDQDKRIRAKLLLLSRVDLQIGLLTALCLDDNVVVRNKAIDKLRKRNDTNNSNS